MTIPGFGRVTTAKLRRNRRNYGLILLLWVGFVVYSVVVEGEVRPSAWFAIVVVAIVLVAVVVSEIELHRRARAGRAPSVDSAPTIVAPTAAHPVEWPAEVHREAPPRL